MGMPEQTRSHQPEEDDDSPDAGERIACRSRCPAVPPHQEGGDQGEGRSDGDSKGSEGSTTLIKLPKLAANGRDHCKTLRSDMDSLTVWTHFAKIRDIVKSIRDNG